MTKMTRTVTALMILTGLTACDSRAVRDFKAERSARLYQDAQADYAAGRLEAAVVGFEKVLRDDPANANARFQLACLLQDARKDSLKAYCAYREFLFLAPDSDKAALARERMAVCEREMADDLAKKMNLAGSAAMASENARLQDELKQVRADCEALKRAMAKAQAEMQAVKLERDDLRKLVSGLAKDGEKPAENLAVTEKDLLDDEESARTAELADALAESAEAEVEEEAASRGPSILPSASVPGKQPEKRAESDKSAPEHPDTYVIQEGDTLYRLANRFYGRTSAWKKIYEANKDKISTDGRIRTGQTIKLPK